MIPFDFGITDICWKRDNHKKPSSYDYPFNFKVLSALKIEFNGSSWQDALKIN